MDTRTVAATGPLRVLGRKHITDLTDLPRAQIIEALERLIFTAAHDWRRSVKIDRHVRDVLVDALKALP